MSAKKRDARAHAASLLGRWTRVTQGHIPLGAGCSCGAGAVSVRVADYERDLLDYLGRKHATAAKAASVPGLLRDLARSATPIEAALLADLERSLESFENLHR